MEWFIQLHRSIQEHWIYKEKSFSNLQAWLDICLSVNYKDNKFLLWNELIEIKRWSFITSELKLMKKFWWSKSKLRNFLKLLQLDKMIEKKSDKNKTTIFVLKYDKYQGMQTSKKPVKDHKKTTKEPQEDTNNNDNNDNNENNDNNTNKKLNDFFSKQLDNLIIARKDYIWLSIKRTIDLEEQFFIFLKKYNLEDFELAFSNYLEEISKREKWTPYYKHRFSLLEFLKNEKWFIKFFNC